MLYIGNKLEGKGFTATTIDTLGPSLESLGYQLRYSSSIRYKAFRLIDMILATIINLRWVDYVIIDTYSTANFWYAIIVSRICRIFRLKYIPILHGGDLPKRLQTTPKIMTRYMNQAYKVVAPSNYLIESLNQEGIQRITHIPNTIALNNYPFKERKAVLPKLLWVRSFASIYNPEMAIKILAQLKKEYPSATLTMVGPEKDGSMQRCKELAEGLNVEVLFTGKISKEDWIDLSASYDMFINTSNFDNLPVSLIEAMALGMPVVSTDVGGIPFLIDDEENGLLVPESHVESAVKAIKRLIDNPDITNSISNKARETSLQYSWSRVASMWQELLER